MKTYPGEIIKIEGSIVVPITPSTTSNNEAVLLPLLIVPGNGPNLMGRNWLHHVKLDWNNICSINSDDIVNKLLYTYSNVFSDQNTPVTGIKANIRVKPNSKPLYYRSRPIPYAMTQKIDNEIDRLFKRRHNRTD